MTTVNLGTIAFTWKGTYSAGTTYAKQDVVQYLGDSYVSLVAGNVGNTPAALTANWQLFAQGTQNIASLAGDIVYHNGSSVTALPVGSTGKVLTVSAGGLPNWELPDIRSGLKVSKLWENGKFQPNAYRNFSVIMTDKTIRGWGHNGQNQIGDGSTSNRADPGRPAFPPGFPGALKYYTNANFASYCIDVNGQVWSWGGNTHGQLADGLTATRSVPQNVSLIVTNSIYGKVVSSLVLGGYNGGACSVGAICSDGTFHMVGFNTTGAIGDGTTTHAYYFRLVNALGTVVDASISRENGAAVAVVNSAGELWIWGANSAYELGDGTTAQRNGPYKNVLGSLAGKTITRVFMGHQFGFAIDSLGNLHAWGTNAYGQLGAGNIAVQSLPILVYTATGGVNAVEVTGIHNDDYHMALLRKSDGTLWATGAGNYGANGHTLFTNTSSFVQVPISLAGGETITKAIRGGTGSYNYCLALTSLGNVWGWGYNVVGQLGIGTFTTPPTATPTLCKTTRPVVDISCSSGTAASEGNAIFLYDDGQVAVSGAGVSYANGDISAYNCATPRPIIF